MFSMLEAKIQTRDDRGAVLVEYAALAVLVVIMMIAALTAFGVSVVDLYTDNNERFSNAVQRNVG